MITALPAASVLSSPATTLPSQAATVQVNKRITDEVVDGRQHLAVSGVKGLPQSVPVVDAKPTGKPGVYSAAVVPGLVPMQISVSKAKPSGITSTSKAITSEQAVPGPGIPLSGFQKAHGHGNDVPCDLGLAPSVFHPPHWRSRVLPVQKGEVLINAEACRQYCPSCRSFSAALWAWVHTAWRMLSSVVIRSRC